MKSENLGGQFERLIAMHQEAPSAIPMPLATVRNVDGELVGYLLEHIEGETLQTLIDYGALDEARRRLGAVEKTVAGLHAKSMPHGDLNASNIVAADDGRTLLIDPVANPGRERSSRTRSVCESSESRWRAEVPPAGFEPALRP